jgi:molybdopterin-guanine dinucleotide biosynthesis protein B
MKVLGITGCEPQAGASLIEGALPALRNAGLKVSVLVEAHDDFDLDRPGKDSHEHRRAGALEVALSSAQRWALMHECESLEAPALTDLVAQLSEVDLLLVLGFEAELRESLASRQTATAHWALLSAPADGDPMTIAGLILAEHTRAQAPAVQRS